MCFRATVVVVVMVGLRSNLLAGENNAKKKIGYSYCFGSLGTVCREADLGDRALCYA